MKIAQFLDATYLKTANEAGISEKENLERIVLLVEEAILHHYKLVMLRINYIQIVKEIVEGTGVLLGTVIDFPLGTSTLAQKLQEATRAIELGVDELDFVINYTAFKKGNIVLVREEVFQCIVLCLQHRKVAKFIIETAALSNEEIVVVSQLIRRLVLQKFGIENASSVFVKSSTGFFKTHRNSRNGATLENMQLILDNAKPLKVKAAGGVRDYAMALKMLAIGVDRIGTSSSKEIVNKEYNINSDY